MLFEQRRRQTDGLVDVASTGAVLDFHLWHVALLAKLNTEKYMRTWGLGKGVDGWTGGRSAEDIGDFD